MYEKYSISGGLGSVKYFLNRIMILKDFNVDAITKDIYLLNVILHRDLQIMMMSKVLIN